jgi:4-hydroxy-tetrahydrodipicolinate reductase
MSFAEARLCVVGAGGRLGSAVVGLAGAHGFRVVLERRRGDAAPSPAADAVIDVSDVSALADSVRYAESCGAALVVGVSGLTPPDRARLEQAATGLRVLLAENFSFGHHVQQRLAEVLAASCADAAEFLVVDRHPTTKRDAPSATAGRLAQLVRSRGGAAEIASLRCGPPVSAHAVVATLPGETIEISHAVSSRDVLADGALRGARWLLGAAGPGLFTMRDVYDGAPAAAVR